MAEKIRLRWIGVITYFLCYAQCHFLMRGGRAEAALCMIMAGHSLTSVALLVDDGDCSVMWEKRDHNRAALWDAKPRPRFRRPFKEGVNWVIIFLHS